MDPRSLAAWEGRGHRSAAPPIHARLFLAGAPPGAPDLVLLHGIGMSGRSMIPTARLLAPVARVFVPDLPGTGRSRAESGVPPGPAELADALTRFLDEAGLERAHIVANASGCEVAIDLAARRPWRVASLVLVGPTGDPEARSWPRRLARWARNAPREPLALAPILVRDWLDAGLRRGLGTSARSLRDPLERKLPWVEAPVLALRGSLDPIAPARWVGRIAREVQRGRVAVVPGATHTVSYQSPLELSRVVRASLGLPLSDAKRRLLP